MPTKGGRVNVDRFRALLLEERQRVADAIDYLHEENPGSMEDETQETRIDNHLAETASVTLDREIDYSLEENAENVLSAIDAALKKIEAGTFGRCARCGQPIAEERLEAMPHAALCIDCKRLEERG
jgi:RNA polymerase-binding protein DksA